MASDIFTFSIRDDDDVNQALMARLQEYTTQTGITKSHIILKSLQLYEDVYIDRIKIVKEVGDE